MKVKVESVIKGMYGYDSVYVTINNEHTCIAFDEKDEVTKYDGKFVDIENIDGKYTIKEFVELKKK